MKSSGQIAALVLAVILGAGPAGAQAPAPAYRGGLLSVAADPTDQTPLGDGLIRGFAREGFPDDFDAAFAEMSRVRRMRS